MSKLITLHDEPSLEADIKDVRWSELSADLIDINSKLASLEYQAERLDMLIDRVIALEILVKNIVLSFTLNEKDRRAHIDIIKLDTISEINEYLSSALGGKQ